MSHHAAHVDTRMRYSANGCTVTDRKDSSNTKTFDTPAEAEAYKEQQNMNDFYATSNGMMNGAVEMNSNLK